MTNGSFGGLCERGHDVPVGAAFCPACGAPAHRPTDPFIGDGGPKPPPASAPWSGPPAYGPPPAWQGPTSYGAPPGAWPGPAPPPYGPPGPSGPPGVYPGYPYPTPPGYWPPVGVSRPTNGFAVASLVLGILWVYWVGSIFAIVFGHIALRQVSRSGHRGRGMAIAGLVLGYIGLVTLIASIFAVSAISP